MPDSAALRLALDFNCNRLRAFFTFVYLVCLCESGRTRARAHPRVCACAWLVVWVRAWVDVHVRVHDSERACLFERASVFVFRGRKGGRR